MMPKLPPSTPVYTSLLSWKSDPYYTQEQLIAYGRAVAEACAVICEAEQNKQPDDGISGLECAAAIREAAKEIGK